MNVEWILSSSVLILLVVLVRFLGQKKVPPCLRYALWLVVALRLLCPVSFSETDISILNLLPGNDMAEETPEGENGQHIYEMNKESDDVSAEPGILGTISQPDMTESDITLPLKQTETEIALQDHAESERVFSIRRSEIDLNGALRFFWLLGTGVCGCVFLVVNLDYGRRLRRSRKYIAPENLPVPSEAAVYETQVISSPCLFGLFAPAVYVTEDTIKEEKTFAFVLCHETTHYRQHDHLWAFIRILCLCAHWFNPLVWLAAHLSRQDGEMSCDEKVLRMLGDKSRADYGRTLLELSAEKGSYINGWRISTTMSGRARQMKERLRMIINTPRRTIGIQVFMAIVVILLFVITFTGKSMAQEIQGFEFVQMDKPAEVSKTVEPGESIALDNRVETENRMETEDYSEIGEVTPEVDEEGEWVVERRQEQEGQYSTTYFRYDEEKQLHMVRYVEEDKSPDAVFEKFDLTYVEDDSIYTLPAVVDDTDIHRTIIAMAKQSLMELYRWTGAKVDTACFQVTNMGSVYFGVTSEDIAHSRVFYSRSFGADTEYNLSGYDKSISDMYVPSGRRVWYSPVLWRVFPKQIDKMTDEEIIIWYLERTPLVEDCKVKSIEKRYEDMWTVQTEEGVWFEVVYDVELKEIGTVSGPYPDYPIH